MSAQEFEGTINKPTMKDNKIIITGILAGGGSYIITLPEKRMKASMQGIEKKAIAIILPE